jgi:hypothetical protein
MAGVRGISCVVGTPAEMMGGEPPPGQASNRQKTQP